MSKSLSDSPESATTASDPKNAPAEAVTRTAAQIKLNDSHHLASYANFCRVTGTPEELIIDFGLNPQPFNATVETLAISQRLIVSFYTAKRLLAALQMSVARHEQAFGVLETDVQKQVQPAAMRQGSRQI